jgi:hypothetical protein
LHRQQLPQRTIREGNSLSYCSYNKEKLRRPLCIAPRQPAIPQRRSIACKLDRRFETLGLQCDERHDLRRKFRGALHVSRLEQSAFACTLRRQHCSKTCSGWRGARRRVGAGLVVCDNSGPIRSPSLCRTLEVGGMTGDDDERSRFGFGRCDGPGVRLGRHP